MPRRRRLRAGCLAPAVSYAETQRAACGLPRFVCPPASGQRRGQVLAANLLSPGETWRIERWSDGYCILEMEEAGRLKWGEDVL